MSYVCTSVQYLVQYLVQHHGVTVAAAVLLWLPHICSRTQSQSDLSVWSMCRGIRGAQLHYCHCWCRTPYKTFFPLHPSTHRSVSFDTVLSPTWAAVTPIMQQPATWVPPRSHAHLTGSSVVFLVVSFHSETYTPSATSIQHNDRPIITDWIFSLPSSCTDWIFFFFFFFFFFFRGTWQKR